MHRRSDSDKQSRENPSREQTITIEQQDEGTENHRGPFQNQALAKANFHGQNASNRDLNITESQRQTYGSASGKKSFNYTNEIQMWGANQEQNEHAQN